MSEFFGKITEYLAKSQTRTWLLRALSPSFSSVLAKRTTHVIYVFSRTACYHSSMHTCVHYTKYIYQTRGRPFKNNVLCILHAHEGLLPGYWCYQLLVDFVALLQSFQPLWNNVTFVRRCPWFWFQLFSWCNNIPQNLPFNAHDYLVYVYTRRQSVKHYISYTVVQVVKIYNNTQWSFFSGIYAVSAFYRS